MKTNGNAKRYIEVNEQKVLVSEEVYRAYKRPAWTERQRKRRAWRCRINGHRCMKDCSTCSRLADGAHLSLEQMQEDGLDILSSEVSPEDVVIQKVMLEELNKVMEQLSPKDKTILKLFGEGMSDRRIAQRTGIPQTTVSYRRKRLIQFLREELKDFC